MNVSLTIKGEKEIIEKIGALEAAKWKKTARLAVGQTLQAETSPYPPSSVANSPSNEAGRWYERGYGTKWKVKSGEVHGRRTSETLNRKWYVKDKGDSVEVGNTASYSGYVHDKEVQAQFHADRGWKTVQGTWDEQVPMIEQSLAREAEKLWAER